MVDTRSRIRSRVGLADAGAVLNASAISLRISFAKPTRALPQDRLAGHRPIAASRHPAAPMTTSAAAGSASRPTKVATAPVTTSAEPPTNRIQRTARATS